MSASATAVLNVARSQLGYIEGRDNDTKFGRWYGMNRQPWCAMFISWCAATAKASDIIPRHAYTPTGAEWFQKHGQWGHTPHRGAIVYFRFSGPRIHHVGIVEDILPDGRIQTIEGNTASADLGSQNNGGGVWRRLRNTRSVVGYGYPRYAAEARRASLPARPARSAHRPPLRVDGQWGKATVRALQGACGVPARHCDGVRGPETNRYLQRWLRREQDGTLNAGDWMTLQRKIGAKVDGSFGSGSVRALQAYLNRL